MRQSPVNTSQSPSIKSGSKSLSKPPVPPKPILSNKAKSLSYCKHETKNDQNIKTYRCEQTLPPFHQSYIKGETFPPPVETLQAQDGLKIISLPIMVQKDSGNAQKYSPSHGQKGLPPLVKSEASILLSPKSKPYKPHGRTLSASAKNALLMQKLGGTDMSAQGGLRKEIRGPNQDSNNLLVTVNRSIISVNDFNDNANNNSSINYINKIGNNCVIINGCSDISNEIQEDKLRNVTLNMDTGNTNFKKNLSTERDSTDRNEKVFSKKTERSLDKHSKSINRPDDKPQTNERENALKHIDSLDLSRQKLMKNLDAEYSKERLDKDASEQPVVDEVDSFCDRTTLNLSTSSLQLGCSQSAPCSPAAKPTLQKSKAIDLDDLEYYKKLSRGISRATDNVNLVSKARTELAQGIWNALESGNSFTNSPFFVETPIYTFTLPDLSVYSDEFRTFLEKDLIEMSTLVSLEAVDRLNWWAIIGASQRLWPLATTGDGNCLLHAASLGMWGFHDRLLTLRKALYEFLSQSQYSQPLWRRWRWQVAMQNKKTGLVYNQEEWEAEWANVIRLASSTPRGGSQSSATTGSAPDLSLNPTTLSQGKLNADCTGHVYESLEEIHVLALAHILRRPIIVVADTTLKDVNGAPFAPIPFGGIYLPLECPPRECQRSPLLLTYDAAHFSALVVMESQEKTDPELPAVIPVTDCYHELLPIQFLVDPGEEFVWGQDEHDPLFIQKLTITVQDKKGLLNEYLDLMQIPIPSSYLEAAAAFSASEDPESAENFGNDHVDLEKKSSESSFDSDDGPPFSDSGVLSTKTKASKQLQTVVKQFGSIGRSMSKRIKKNLNTLSKFSRTGSFRKKGSFSRGSYGKGGKMVHISILQNYILSARIHTDKRVAYQEEMINNYLNTARLRFNKKNSQQHVIEDAYKAKDEDSCDNGQSAPQCINPGCTLYGTAETSYMCSTCFAKQKEEEEKEYNRQSSNEAPHANPTPKCDGPQYGAGKSKFYAELDETSVKSAALIPVTRSLSSVRDKTLFLSNSTFYNDSSSIPSYNLRGSKPLCESSSGGSRSLANEASVSAKVDSGDAPHSNVGSLKTSTKMTLHESLVPICIDDVRIQLNNRLATKSKESPSLMAENGPPMACLSNGCEFYGNFSTEGFCSKCHLAKKKKSLPKVDSYNVEQVKYVHI